MKKLVAVLATILISAWVGSAAPVPCPTASYQVYVDMALAGDSCYIDDKVFSNFFYHSASYGGAVEIPASGVSVVPFETPLNPGFMFNAGWSVGPGQSQDSHFIYDVTVQPGGNAITDVSALINGFGVTGDPNGGFITVGESFVPDQGRSLSLAYGLGLNITSDRLDLSSPVWYLEVTKNITVSGNDGSASVSGVYNHFSETGVPEPLTLLLMGSGLLGLGALRLRKKS